MGSTRSDPRWWRGDKPPRREEERLPRLQASQSATSEGSSAAQARTQPGS